MARQHELSNQSSHTRNGKRREQKNGAKRARKVEEAREAVSTIQISLFLCHSFCELFVLFAMMMLRSLFLAPRSRQHARSALRYKSAATAMTQDWLQQESNDDTPVYKSWVNGSFCSSSATEFFPVTNPATNQVIGRVPQNTPEELSQAMECAQDAFESWKKVPIQQRQRCMLEYQALIRQHTDELAHIITHENGKTLADARGDIFRGLEVVETTCMMADKLLGESLGGIASSMDCVSYRQPLGVCAGIAPFNFPAMIPLWMFPVAW